MSNKWGLHKTVDKLNEHLLNERECSPQCVVCGEYLFDSESEIIDYTNYLEFQKQVIDLWVKNKSRADIFYVYRYSSNPIVAHHISYVDDICIPVCHSCHGKIHGNRNNPEYKDFQPDMKKSCCY